MPVSNPFFHRGPIRDQAYFFGRERVTRQALSLLGNGQSVSIIDTPSQFRYNLCNESDFNSRRQK
jgi:hypothetical protein